MNPASSHLASGARLPDDQIFLPADYQHRLRLGRCPPGAFFQPWPPESDLLAERRRWIADAPQRHALALDAAAEPLAELAELAPTWTGLAAPPPRPASPRAWTATLGAHLEPDFVLLSRTSAPPVVVAACVCFPSSWAPEEKLGASLEQIHAVVPALNATLGPAVDGFLARLKPGTAWVRANWGLSASPERNQHPARQLARLQPPFDAASTWLRMEHQALLVLPRTGAILFGIRIEQRPFSDLTLTPAAAHALARALRTMPEPMAVYKGIQSIRHAAVEHLLARAPTPSM